MKHKTKTINYLSFRDMVARLVPRTADAGPADGFPVVFCFPGIVEGLPEYVMGTYLIVSSMVAQHPDIAITRPDVLAPNTGPTAIRENGQIVAVRGFQRF
jgi:hypothetical protein